MEVDITAPWARNALVALGATLISTFAATANAQFGNLRPPVFGPPNQATVPATNASWSFRTGIEERFRFEDMDNLVDHSDDTADKRVQYRFRTRLWASGDVGRFLSFGVMLNNESKGQSEPSMPLTLDETILESAWVTLAPSRRVSFKIGRQDINKAEGFIWRDGTPGDGSRTDYSNAIVASFGLSKNSTLELIAASNPATDTYLPVIHDQGRRLIEWDEQITGVYFTKSAKPGSTFEAYYFHKRESNDPRPQTNPLYRPNREINTVGMHGRSSGGTAWSTWYDAAYQFGTQGTDTNVKAWALAFGAERRLNGGWKPTLRTAYTALSGDSPDTTTVEGWDPLVSRWPMYSDAFLYSLGPEAGNAYWTNLKFFKAELALTPSNKSAFRMTYYWLSAFHPVPWSPEIFGSGTSRGGLFQTRLDLTVNSHFRGYVQYERLSPGEFYSHGSPSSFLRVELVASWSHRWH